LAIIHRAALTGGTVCGKLGNVSVSGACVSCPECKTENISREETLKIIEAAAARFRAVNDVGHRKAGFVF